jgi:hypothetical protein
MRFSASGFTLSRAVTALGSIQPFSTRPLCAAGTSDRLGEDLVVRLVEAYEIFAKAKL